jgi:hypothetical protein
MYDRLNFFLQNSNFYSYRLSDFTIYISFMRIMVEYINSVPITYASELILECRQLFMTIMGQLYVIIKSSRNTLKTIKYIAQSYVTKFVDKTTTGHINRLQSEIKSCNKTINRFLNGDTFTTLFAESLQRFNISTDLSHPSYNEIISLLPAFTYKWYKPNNIIDNLVQKVYIDNIGEIFKTTGVNIHTKVKFITESDAVIFNTPDTIRNLIEYYSEIERFNENTGFYEKELTRSYIIFAILEYIYPTGQMCDPLIMIPTPLLCEKDHINERLSIFNTIDPNIMRPFITLLISEITELFNDINVSVEKLTSGNKKDIMIIYKYITSISHISIYYKLITVLFNNTTNNDTFFIEKYSELAHTILLNSLNTRIYCELDEFTKSDYGILNIMGPELAKMVSEFYHSFYTDIFKLTNRSEYIKHLVDNDELYDRKCISDTARLIGFIYISDLNIPISIILKDLLWTVDKAIFTKTKTAVKYDEELPFEFQDPIYYTAIINPIELPNTKNIVEKSVILNHLVFNQTNPFDGLELTLKDLLDYNKLPEVIERIAIFTTNYNNWKLDHTI